MCKMIKFIVILKSHLTLGNLAKIVFWSIISLKNCVGCQSFFESDVMYRCRALKSRYVLRAAIRFLRLLYYIKM